MWFCVRYMRAVQNLTLTSLSPSTWRVAACSTSSISSFPVSSSTPSVLHHQPHLSLSPHLRRLFYIINLIFPCLLIYAVSFLGFFLPVESGEKVNLEITILLALVVFLLIVGETLPPTPDAIPVLGQLYLYLWLHANLHWNITVYFA